MPEIFGIIKKKGNVPEKEMHRTLNMGIGMVIIADKNAAEKVRKQMKGARIIGHIEKGSRNVEIK